jgi:hypothetical protein
VGCGVWGVGRGKWDVGWKWLSALRSAWCSLKVLPVVDALHPFIRVFLVACSGVETVTQARSGRSFQRGVCQLCQGASFAAARHGGYPSVCNAVRSEHLCGTTQLLCDGMWPPDRRCTPAQLHIDASFHVVSHTPLRSVPRPSHSPTVLPLSM